MLNEDFISIFHQQMQKCEDVLVLKAKEYATEDRLHNFKVAAKMQGIAPRQALAGMMSKHTVSIYDMCGSSESFTTEAWEEKITDNLNYLLLLKAIVLEEPSRGPLKPLPFAKPSKDFLSNKAIDLINPKDKNA